MPDTKPALIVITDTSCFIILEKINALHLLPRLFDTIITTPEIAREYGNNLPFWVQIKVVRNTVLKQQYNMLIDPGEASAIALAQEISSDYLLTDDLAARKFAENLGLQVKGSAGVLLYAKQMGIITKIRPYIEKMQQTNFRISDALVNRVLASSVE